MIKVVSVDPEVLEPDAVLRSVSSETGADTAFSRDLERRAGSEVSDRLLAMGDLPVGAAVITPGGDLKIPFVIHVVLQSPEEPVSVDGVRTAFLNGLRRAGEWGLGRIAVPPLGTGAGNLDSQEAAAVMLRVLKDHWKTADNPQEVFFLAGTPYEREVFEKAIEGNPPGTSPQPS
jgi:O-acetyl-ADP-ribose deacetylase (regulator of RNase III)